MVLAIAFAIVGYVIACVACAKWLGRRAADEHERAQQSHVRLVRTPAPPFDYERDA